MSGEQVILQSKDDLLEAAWGIIANASNWAGDTPEWIPAAEKWRDEYFAVARMKQCPRCEVVGETKYRSCGCIEYLCGGVQTCDDYHHGDGVFLADCLETSVRA